MSTALHCQQWAAIAKENTAIRPFRRQSAGPCQALAFTSKNLVWRVTNLQNPTRSSYVRRSTVRPWASCQQNTLAADSKAQKHSPGNLVAASSLTNLSLLSPIRCLLYRQQIIGYLAAKNGRGAPTEKTEQFHLAIRERSFFPKLTTKQSLLSRSLT